MPGVCLRTGAAVRQGAFEDTLLARRHLDDYETTVTIDAPALQLGHVAYPSYPIRLVENDTHFLCLEGELYGDTDADRLLDLATTGAEGVQVELADKIQMIDGEFVVYVVEKATGDVVVVTDDFSRLPLYYHSTADGAVLGREIGFVLDHVRSPSFDRLGVAECLLFGYLLDDRTLWTDVKKVPPAGVVSIDGSGGVSIHRRFEFDFDDPVHRDRSVDENARALADRFRAACRRRAGGSSRNVISLSGGHDSRAVVAAFGRLELPYVAATFHRHAEEPSADVRVARDVADALDADWTRYDLPPHRLDSVRTLLGMKCGLNHAGMGFILPFFERLREDFGSDATCVTGDGGDKALPDLRPPRSLAGFADLTDYTIARNSVFPLPEVARLTGLDEAAIRDEVRTTLEEYPESDPRHAYVHFLTHNRGFNWLFEGEDRNRCYLWSTTPFYGRSFFEYAMNVPGQQKSNNELYRAFLAELWPRSIEFDDADFGTPMASPRYRLVQYGLSVVERFPQLTDAVGTVYRGEVGFSCPAPVATIVESGVETCDPVRSVLVPEAVRSFVDPDRGRADSRAQAFHLFTIVAAVDAVACGGRTLADHENVVLE